MKAVAKEAAAGIKEGITKLKAVTDEIIKP